MILPFYVLCFFTSYEGRAADLVSAPEVSDPELKQEIKTLKQELVRSRKLRSTAPVSCQPEFEQLTEGHLSEAINRLALIRDFKGPLQILLQDPEYAPTVEAFFEELPDIEFIPPEKRDEPELFGKIVDQEERGRVALFDPERLERMRILLSRMIDAIADLDDLESSESVRLILVQTLDHAEQSVRWFSSHHRCKFKKEGKAYWSDKEIAKHLPKFKLAPLFEITVDRAPASLQSE